MRVLHLILSGANILLSIVTFLCLLASRNSANQNDDPAC